MTNLYFSASSYTPLARATTGRAEAVDAIISAIVAGFDLLPTPTQLKEGTANFVATDTGVANAYVIALPYVPLAYDDGLEICFRAAVSNTNTGASTVNVNSLGVAGLRDYAGNQLAAAAVLGLGLITARYDATMGYFRIISPNVVNTGSVTIGVSPTVAGTASQITVALAGANYTISLPAAITLPGTITVPATAGAGAGAIFSTVQMGGLTSSQVSAFNAGLTATSINVGGLIATQLAALQGGLTVTASTSGTSLSTTAITGLTATLTGTLTGGTQLITGGKYKGTIGVINPLGSITGSNAIDYTLGNIITATQNNAALTYTFTNWPASGTYGFLEIITTLDATPHSVTFTGVTWDTNLGAPTLVASKKLVVILETDDGGSTIRASMVGQF